MNVLVLGATGFVGRALVPALRRAGEVVRAASRRPPERGFGDVPWVRCDLEAPETLPQALEGVDCAYYLVHSLGRGHDFRAVDRASAATFARAAAMSGCKRVVYLGGVAPSSHPSEHLASRLEVGEVLRSTAVPTIELRAAMIVGNGSASWRIVRDLAARLPIMILPRWLDSKSCPIALPDVVTALLDARHVPLAKSEWFDVPGPDVLSAREMLLIVAALLGRRLPTVRVPVLTPRLSAMWLKLVTGADYALARELVLGLEQDLLPKDARYYSLTGHVPGWSFRVAAHHALATEPMPPLGARLEELLVQRLGPHVR